MSRSPIITLILSVFFLFAAVGAFNSYDHFFSNQKKIDALQVRVRITKRYKKELERQQSVLNRLKRFVDGAASLGLNPNNWATYDVAIQEPVRYEELERIINQCVNTPAYYFKPMSLHARRNLKTGKKLLKPDAPTTDENEFDGSQGDIFLNLQGTFLVKQK
ncbi:MAG: hypothetical protein PVG08_07215 [Desulfobacterales bacterium]|jgi:hypothetical protein